MLDELAHRVLGANPCGLLLSRIYLSTPEWWGKESPDECQVLANGSRFYLGKVSMKRGGRAFPPLASAEWRNDTAAALQHLIQEGRTEVALLLKPMRRWTSAFTLNPVLPAAFLRSLTRHAGVQLYSEREGTLYAKRHTDTFVARAPQMNSVMQVYPGKSVRHHTLPPHE